MRERLAVMEQKNELTTWHDGEITAGDEWYEDISKNLTEADILLYLVSAASLASKNCNKELAEALTADLKVIPIILEHCDWMQHQISDFEVLPLKGKPISKWEDPSEGWQNVVDGIRAAINKMQVQAKPSVHITPEERETLVSLAFQWGNFLSMLEQMDLAIVAYSRAIELNPNNAAAYNNRGNAHREKSEIDKAIADCNKAIELNPQLAEAYNNRGAAYGANGEFDLALADCSKAIELASEDARVYNNLGVAYVKKGELNSAIVNFTKAIELNPDHANAYNNRGISWLYLREWENFRSDLSAARDVGVDIAIGFRNLFGSVANFEQITGIRLPEDIAAMLTPSS